MRVGAWTRGRAPCTWVQPGEGRGQGRTGRDSPWLLSQLRGEDEAVVLQGSLGCCGALPCAAFPVWLSELQLAPLPWVLPRFSSVSSRPRLPYGYSLCRRNPTGSFYCYRATKTARVRARALVQDAPFAIVMPGFPTVLKPRWLSGKGRMSQSRAGLCRRPAPVHHPG